MLTLMFLAFVLVVGVGAGMTCFVFFSDSAAELSAGSEGVNSRQTVAKQ
jgi:hypothetical protein